MGLTELFLSVLIVGVSCINAALPVAALRRSGDRRFLVLAGAHGGLALLGGIWTWGELPGSPPAWATGSLPAIGLVAFVVLLFLVATLWPRAP